MLKRWSYILLLVSVSIIVSHNIIAHHHHYEIEIAHTDHQGDTEEDNDHNIFSFGQLDETYLHVNHQTEFSNGFVCLFLVQSVFSFECNVGSDKQEFSSVEIYPPPNDPYLLAYSLRGPPVS